MKKKSQIEWLKLFETLSKGRALTNTTKYLGSKQLNNIISYKPTYVLGISLAYVSNEWRFKQNRLKKKKGLFNFY